MNEEKDLIITLDNGKKYTIVYNLIFNEKKYIYLGMQSVLLANNQLKCYTITGVANERSK